MSDLNRYPIQIKLKQGLAADINTIATKYVATEGEPHYTTDTHKFYIFDGSNNERVHGLDLALIFEDEVVVNSGEIVWL